MNNEVKGVRTLLLTVEATFQLKERLVLAPDVPLHVLAKTYRGPVTLKRTDGIIQIVEANCVVPHDNPSPVLLNTSWKPSYTCILHDIEQAAVPVGTEVWLENG